MLHKLLIVSTDPTLLQWKSLSDKIKSITEALNKTKNGNWQVDVTYSQSINPEIKDGRITHSWFNNFAYPLFRQGHQHVYLHFSMERWTELGLDAGIRGANHRDSDFVGESYGRGNEHTRRGRTRENQFIQNVLHEMSHELARSTRVVDRTHLYHDRNPDISGIFGSYDMSKWQPEYQKGIGIIAKLQDKLKSLLYAKK